MPVDVEGNARRNRRQSGRRKKARNRAEVDAEYRRMLGVDQLPTLSPGKVLRKRKKRRQDRQVRIRPSRRQSPLSAAEYAAYMKSREWARRKIAYFQTHVRICLACGSTTRIHLHHLTYERLGCEADGDLRPLCESCHAGVHEHHRLFGGTLHDATIIFIERKRGTA